MKTYSKRTNGKSNKIIKCSKAFSEVEDKKQVNFLKSVGFKNNKHHNY